jgi:D-beta-D-heptose 7-phosphate kinase/D-beta-D-heptose 1-phosphate adenosyltransferase
MPTLPDPRARELVPQFAGRRILVVGDLMLDHFLWGHVDRISPEAPVPVVRVQRESFHPGGCGNVAANLAALGGVPVLLAPVGEDVAGEHLRRELEAGGIDASHLLPVPGRVTTKKTRIVAHHQQVVRFDREEERDLAGEEEARLLAQATELLDGVDAVVVSDYDKGTITPRVLEALLPAARKAGVVAAVDPKLRHFPLYRPATLITPNLKEASHGVGFPLRTEDDVLRAGEEIRKMLGAEGVLLTRGEDGMSLFEGDGKVTHIPAPVQEVFDVTGAGDTVIAAATLALAAGGSLLEAAMLANRAAGIAIGKLGTATVSPEELAGAARSESDPGR